MKAYLLNITALVLFSAVIDTILPQKWNKYIKIITALMVTAVIISPVSRFEMPDFKEYKAETEEFTQDGTELQNEMIKNELEKRIEKDIDERLFQEFRIEVKSEVRVLFNEENEISGIKSIKISGDAVGGDAIKRINEIYAPLEVTVDEY